MKILEEKTLKILLKTFYVFFEKNKNDKHIISKFMYHRTMCQEKKKKRKKAR